jgi:hypothetical protein
MTDTDTDADEILVFDHEPGKIKAVWHLKTTTGKEAAVLREMQNQAIINLLTWAASRGNDAGNKPADGREIGGNGSRETLELAA